MSNLDLLKLKLDWLDARYKVRDKIKIASSSTEAELIEREELDAYRKYIRATIESDSKEIINEPDSLLGNLC